MLPLLLLASIGLRPFGATSAWAAGGSRPSTAVVFVGGLGSTPVTTRAVFGPLASALRAEGGFDAQELLAFSYDPGSPAYLASQTCQPLATSSEHLASFVRNLHQEQHIEQVILVGHSMGGVIALDAAASLLQDGDDASGGASDAEQATPIVRRVVTVDSPLGGLSNLQRGLIADLWLGPCAAAADAAQRYVDRQWPATLAWRVENLLAHDVQVTVVANPADLLLDLRQQQVPNSGVNVVLQADDGGLSHSAALELPMAVAELARLLLA